MNNNRYLLHVHVFLEQSKARQQSVKDGRPTTANSKAIEPGPETIEIWSNSFSSQNRSLSFLARLNQMGGIQFLKGVGQNKEPDKKS